MTTLRHSPGIRGVIAAVLVAAVLVAPASVVSAADGESDTTQADDAATAQARLDADRALAAETAARIASAESEQAELERAIAQGETAIPALRTRADELRVVVRARAARLYMRVATPRLDAVVGVDHVVDVARATHLTATVGDHDTTAASVLQEMARAVEDRQVHLREQRAELEATLASLVQLQDTLEGRLRRAVAAYRTVRVAATPRGEPTQSVVGSEDAVWLTFRECTFAFESGGNYRIVSSNGLYYGAWQFAIGTWNAVAARMGRDDLVGVLPSDASPADQDAVAHQLWLESGNRPWGGRC